MFPNYNSQCKSYLRGSFFLLTFLLSLPIFAQQTPGRGAGAQMSAGRFYGKVVDENGKGVGYANVTLHGMRFDTVSRSMKETLIAGQFTEDNGDFSLENLPVMGDFTLTISFLGYGDVKQKVTFGIPMRKPGEGGGPGGGGKTNPGETPRQGGGNQGGMAGKLDKDLGNILLAVTSQTLGTVTVETERSKISLALDKKVYRVDKDAVAAGGTAEDALKNVPSIAVDLDGNVTLRNSAPQIFVDGRPTTFTLEQIPADAIEQVEVITNPSAKYDASGGNGGIVNIVLKKERRIGYNGSVRAGVDSRGKFNGGADINAREGKLNAFLSANYNQRKNLSESETDRENYFGSPFINILQTSENRNTGLFRMGRAGLDWFIDNRNTLTIAGSLHGGSFKSNDDLTIHYDSLYVPTATFGTSSRHSDTEREFRNGGAQLLYKRIFPKEGRELTADANWNRSRNENHGNYSTTYEPFREESLERQDGSGGNDFLTFQTDFVNPISDRIKIELGAKAALRDFYTNNLNERFNADLNDYQVVNSFSDHYRFNDKVFALYGQMGHQFPKWGYQLGLRAESSQYTGELTDVDSTFTNDYPFSLFPSGFFTYKLNEEDVVQLAYTRRIVRPNFFQLIPFTDFSDSLNLQRGNPNLLPEFTNSLELSYQNIFKKGHNLMFAIYYKRSTDLITRFQQPEIIPELNNDTLQVSSFLNANNSRAYGAEFTLRSTFFEKLELTTNINVFQARVDASNIQSDLVNDQFSYFIKENLNLKLPASFSLQLSAEYRSKAAVSTGGGPGGGGPGGGGGGRGPGGGGGGGGWGGGPTSTAQGYQLANWFMDAGLRKDLFNKKASLTINVQDIFRTRKNGTHTETGTFLQDTWRVRDPQLVRVNFSYRFGKMDASLFKRKNMNSGSEGMDSM